MIVCKIVAQIVATAKHPILDNRTVFAVQPIDAEGKETGDSFLAIDTVQAGPGDTVVVMKEGSSCSQILGVNKGCINSVIAGIVDSYCDRKI